MSSYTWWEGLHIKHTLQERAILVVNLTQLGKGASTQGLPARLDCSQGCTTFLDCGLIREGPSIPLWVVHVRQVG